MINKKSLWKRILIQRYISPVTIMDWIGREIKKNPKCFKPVERSNLGFSYDWLLPRLES